MHDQARRHGAIDPVQIAAHCVAPIAWHPGALDLLERRERGAFRRSLENAMLKTSRINPGRLVYPRRLQRCVL